MTVAELIAKLQTLPQDSHVVIERYTIGEDGDSYEDYNRLHSVVDDDKHIVLA